MTIYKGFIKGIKSGILEGINSIWDLITPLSNLDFSEPVIQEFPATSSALAALLGDASAVADRIYPCQESSGNLVDSILGNELVPTLSPLQGQTATGLGTTLINRNAIEGVTTFSRFEATDNTISDYTTGSWGFIFVFRASSTDSHKYILRKRNGAGYYVRLDNNTGRLFALVTDGGGNFHQPATTTGNYGDGAWHMGILSYDSTTGTTTLRSEISSGTDSAATLASISNTDKFTLCDNGVGVQISYVAEFTGAAAEALINLGATATNNFWKHASNPTEETVHTLTRPSVSSVSVSSEHICHYAPNTIAMGYDGNFTNETKFGVYIDKAKTNLITDSETLGNWVDGGVSMIDANTSAPDGFKNATRVLATPADNGYIADVMVTTESTEYTLSIYVKDSTSGSTSGRVIFYNETGSAEIGSQVFTTSDTWTRVSLTATSAVGQVSSSFRLEVDTLADSIHAWGAQCETGAWATTYVRSLGAAGVSDDTVLRYLFLAPSDFCEVKSISTRIAISSNGGAWNALSAVGNENRKRLLVNTTFDSVTLYDGAGATEDSINIAHSGFLGEEVNRVIWDQSPSGVNTGGYESVFVYQGVTYNGQVSPWDGTIGGAEVFLIDVGQIGSGGAFVSPGCYQLIASYDKLTEPLP